MTNSPQARISGEDVFSFKPFELGEVGRDAGLVGSSRESILTMRSARKRSPTD